MCTESGLDPALRRALVAQALAGQAKVHTDPQASPTGFPFKVAGLAGSLSDPDCYTQRPRVCDLGFLRETYRKSDGSLGYRCAAEPESAFLAKGGDAGDLAGRKCLCNGLVANVGMAQHRPDGSLEPPLVTLGDDYANIGRFCANGPEFTAADVIRHLLA